MLKQLMTLFQQDASDPGAFGNRKALAACVVLLEAAWADDECTSEERSHILNVLENRFGLSPAEAKELFGEAAAQRKESSGLWQFTRGINEACPVPEKIQILEEVWRLFYSDGVLTGHEDYLAHKLRALLNLNHPQLIDAKMKVLREVRGE